MEMAKVSSKGQINIPIAIRKHLNLDEGDKVIFIVDGDGVRMLNAASLMNKEGGSSPAEKA
ncbi:AbrB/MazE/SpoVT family DNA-binding domain-containing protein [Desulfovibrio sp. OttesenSCG-928-G15]|nr:AbrB/MazE/SpoVT family DNA-binding domain-containing protein [Desulfovibrio sp. OttesenSCG-928-G15]